MYRIRLVYMKCNFFKQDVQTIHVICPYRVFNKYDFIRINDEVNSNALVILNFYRYIYYVCNIKKKRGGGIRLVYYTFKFEFLGIV